MAKKKKKEKKFTKKLLHKYRLVILNEDTFEERFAIKLTRLNVFVLTSLSAILLVFFTILLIAFTPLREYIPGYSSAKLKKEDTLREEEPKSLAPSSSIPMGTLSSIPKIPIRTVAYSYQKMNQERPFTGTRSWPRF